MIDFFTNVIGGLALKAAGGPDLNLREFCGDDSCPKNHQVCYQCLEPRILVLSTSKVIDKENV